MKVTQHEGGQDEAVEIPRDYILRNGISNFPTLSSFIYSSTIFIEYLLHAKNHSQIYLWRWGEGELLIN